MKTFLSTYNKPKKKKQNLALSLIKNLLIKNHP